MEIAVYFGSPGQRWIWFDELNLYYCSHRPSTAIPRGHHRHITELGNLSYIHEREGRRKIKQAHQTSVASDCVPLMLAWLSSWCWRDCPLGAGVTVLLGLAWLSSWSWRDCPLGADVTVLLVLVGLSSWCCLDCPLGAGVTVLLVLMWLSSWCWGDCPLGADVAVLLMLVSLTLSLSDSRCLVGDMIACGRIWRSS